MRAPGLAEGAAAATPGVRGKERDAEDSGGLGASGARWLPGLTAKLDLAAQGRLGDQYVAKEVRQELSAPALGSLR